MLRHEVFCLGLTPERNKPPHSAHRTFLTMVAHPAFSVVTNTIAPSAFAGARLRCHASPPPHTHRRRTRAPAPQMLFGMFRRNADPRDLKLDLIELSAMHPAVEVKGLHKTFKRQTKRVGQRGKEELLIRALDGISFQVARGETLGLLGPNSSGKTTTLRCLATLCAPDSGAIRFYGRDVLEDPRLAREMLGFVSQGDGLDKVLTGREHLEMFGGLAHLPRVERRAAIEELIDVFDLSAFIDRQTAVYSGGVKRRLDLAICLLHRPPILILDEPTVGLDVESRNVIWRVLKQLRDSGAAIILTSHYLEEVDLLSDRVAIMEQGVVLAEGTPTELKNALGGDRVTVRLTEFTELADAQRAADELRKRGLVRECQVNQLRSNSIELVVDPRKSTIGTEIVQALGEIGHDRLFSFAQSKPSLDDVYLAATGRSIADADAAAKKFRDSKMMRKESMAYSADCRASRVLLRANGELERHVLARELLVHALERVRLVLRIGLLFRVKEDAEEARAILLVPHALADNLGGEHKVFQDAVVDAREGSRDRALLLMQTNALALARH
eukprot:IDg4065t1